MSVRRTTTETPSGNIRHETHAAYWVLQLNAPGKDWHRSFIFGSHDKGEVQRRMRRLVRSAMLEAQRKPWQGIELSGCDYMITRWPSNVTYEVRQ